MTDPEVWQHIANLHQAIANLHRDIAVLAVLIAIQSVATLILLFRTRKKDEITNVNDV